MPPKPTPIQERFWDKTDRSGGPESCWRWTGALVGGYGRVSVARRSRLAHRVAFYLTHGRWPTKYCLHLCDAPACCNPAHLADGDQAENMRQCVERGRIATGERHPTRTHPEAFRQKLSPEDIAYALRRIAEGAQQRDVANLLGVTPATIYYHHKRARNG